MSASYISQQQLTRMSLQGNLQQCNYSIVVLFSTLSLVLLVKSENILSK